MKLYEVPPRTWVKIAGEKIFFDHPDGMYSYCLDEAVRILERHKMTEEYKRLEAEYKKGYADGYKQACEIINALQTEAFNRLFSGRDTGLLDGMPEQEKTNDRHR